MPKPIRLLASLALISVSNLALAQQNQSSPSSSYPQGTEAIPLLREAWELGADSIYPPELTKRFDSKTLPELESQLRQSENTALADVLNPFLESLNVSHTRFYDSRHQSYYLLRSLFSSQELDAPELYTIGVQLDETEPGLVRAVMEGSPAAEAGVRRHDRIIAVNDDAFESLLQWQVPGATDLLLQRRGEKVRVTLKPVRQSFHRALARATQASGKVLACGERKIGYLHLWSGTDEVFLETLKARIAEAREMSLDAFILDLRDGYGGAWWPYLDPFYEDRSDYFAYATRDAEGSTEALRAEPQTNREAWTGPLAVLINGGTRSGKESLAFQFKKGDRATVFGSNTAGAFTGGRGIFAERAGDYILYLSVYELLLDGEAIEGRGIAPDVFVEDSPEGDAPLEAALSHLGC